MFLFTGFAIFSTYALADSLSGQVLEGTEPLSGVTLYLFDAQQRYQEAQSNANGEFEFTDVTDGPVRLFAVPDVDSSAIPAFYPNTPDYCSAERIFTKETSTLTIDLETGATLQTQINVDGEPLGNALIKATPDGAWIRGGFSDVNGNVEIGGLPIDSLVTLEIEGDTIPTQWLTHQEPTYDNREAAWLSLNNIGGSIELNPGIAIEGLVHSGPTPIPNANISVYSNSQIRSTQSDDDGLYNIAGLPPGEVLSWMSADGYANTYSPTDDRPVYFEPILDEGELYDLLDIDAPLESTLSVTVLDANTEDPIQGASILLYNDTKTVGRGEPVDETGTAIVRGLHAGRYTLTIFAENDGYYTGDVLDALGEPLWFELEAQTHDTFTVYWEPREQALIQFTDDEGNPVVDILTLLQHDASGDVQREYSKDDGAALMYGLQDGTWNITLSHTPICPNDMGYIIPSVEPLVIPQNDMLEITLLRDHDQDGMPTAWEEEWGLDPHRNDADEDPDDDGLSNLQEYHFGSEPTTFDAPQDCGCASSKSALLWIAPLFWMRRRTGRAVHE